MALSLRASRAAEPSEGLLLFKIMADVWHEESNPDGYISLGIAENTLMHDALSKHIHSNFALENPALTYGDGPGGSKRLRAAMARFLNRQLHPVQPLDSHHITVTNGCSSAIEHISWAVTNPGDGILLGQPYYTTFVPDLTIRTGARVIPVAFDGVDPFSVAGVEKYGDALLRSERLGQKVTALVLCHPHNPLGRCYPKDTLLALMRFCQTNHIHLISDEIYALSVFAQPESSDKTTSNFLSCLAIETEGIIDPSLLHVIWGMSKDFGSNGIRLGAIISQHNPAIHSALLPVGLYSSVSSLTDHIVANILVDDPWTERYIENNCKKLAFNYTVAKKWAEDNGIWYSPGVTAAFFLWVDLGTYYAKQHGTEISWATDDKIMAAMLDHKVFLASGKQFGAEKPGYFRIVFSHDLEILNSGLNRVIEALR